MMLIEMQLFRSSVCSEAKQYKRVEQKVMTYWKTDHEWTPELSYKEASISLYVDTCTR